MGKTELQKLITQNMRIAMALRGKTKQKDLADALGLSKASMSQKFTGKTVWTLEDIANASSYLRVKPEALLSMQFVGPQGLEPWTDGFASRLFAPYLPRINAP